MSDYIELKHAAQLAAECTQMNYLLDAGITNAFRLHATPEAIFALITENESLRVKLEVSEDTRQVLRGSLAQAEEDIDGLRKDAERYRWLRDGAGYCDTRDIPGMAPTRMDEFIDAAISNGEQQ